MKKTLIVSALIALSLTSSGGVFAQRDGHSSDHYYGGDRTQQQNYERHDNNRNDNFRNDSSHTDRSYSHGENHSDHARLTYQDHTQNAAPNYRWNRDSRVSNDYRNSRHIVDYQHGRQESRPWRRDHRDHAGSN
jgi:hypothetical protein